MPSSSPSGRSSSQVRSRTGRLLMIVAALAAAVTAISSIAALSSATVETRLLEAWRAYGLVVFAGLFVLLGLRPHACRGVWELVVFHKTALTGTALVFAARGGATGAGTVVPRRRSPDRSPAGLLRPVSRMAQRIPSSTSH